MPIDGGIQFTGFVAPTDESDTYPVTKPDYGLGGLRRVTGIVARNAIFSARREEGMMVYVEEDTTYYSLIGGTANSDWTQLYIDQASSLGVSGPDGAVSSVANIALHQGQNMTINVAEQGTGTAGITFSVINIEAGTF